MTVHVPKQLEWALEPFCRRTACRAGTSSARRTETGVSDPCFLYYIDAAGRQHFNFSQQIWLHPRVQMAVTSVPTVALETLAVNLLTLATRGRDCHAAIGATSRLALQLASAFCSECLLSAGAHGWVMPRAVVRAWFLAQVRGRQRLSR